MKKQNKERANLTVDPEKRAIFENLYPIHGKTLSDVLDEGLDAIIGDIAPDQYLEMQIKETEIKLAEMKSNLVEAKFLAKQRKIRKEVEAERNKISNDLDSRLEDLRITKYEKNKQSIAYQIKKKTIDWKVVMNVFEFDNRLETKDFITRKLTAEGLI